MLLSSSEPERLRDRYAAALSPSVERTPGDPAYDVLDFDGFYVMIDTRDEVGDANPEPGRVILNFEVIDAPAVAQRITDLGGAWLAELEDRIRHCHRPRRELRPAQVLCSQFSSTGTRRCRVVHGFELVFENVGRWP